MSLHALAEYPSDREAEIVLRDGSTVHVRPVREGDGPEMLRFLKSVSAESIGFRFFGTPDLDWVIQWSLDIDYVDRYALVAESGGVAGVIDYVKSIVGTMIDAHDRQYLEQDQFVRTITISTLGIGTTQFDLSHDQLEDLYQSGRTGAEHFLEAWYAAGGFPAYVAAFRSGPQPPRRKRVTEVMRSSASHMS